jgi:hypothetical protein
VPFTKHHEGDHVKNDEMVGNVEFTEKTRNAFGILVTKPESSIKVGEYVYLDQWSDCLLFKKVCAPWRLVIIIITPNNTLLL